MKYQQLTEGLRYQIACLRDHGLSQARIAKQLGVHPSTISRELRRNCAGQAYQPQQAHQLATARRLTSQKRTVPSDTIDFVCMALVADWSPEQISGVGDMINCPVSHEWIYRYVARDKANELLSNVVYGVGQAAFLSDSSSTCTPSLNFTLFTTNVSSANPLSRFHFFFATSSSL
ncbi:hypothetical protein WP2W18E01_P10410 (plasmid) [Aeromonas caviae]|uniref:Transposase IS30-like HTH domain-containing protein n=1 Tax=Aeromonas caviae TaxID=648 RepID=A0A6S4TCX8_AERCA|nr:hypothetical protein WP2W18E01_P10410 [Aeromonas caviae]